MFDLVQKNKTVVQIVLAMVSLGLVVGFGISGYSAFQDGGNYLAKVGDVEITERDIAEAVNNQNVPAEMRPAIIEQVVQQKLLATQAAALRLSVSDATLREFIAKIDAFQKDGKFDPALYKELLAQQRMTPEAFEQKLKQDLALRQLVGGMAGAGIVSSAMQEKMEKLLGERRELQVSVVSAQEFVQKVAITDAEIQKYYETHSAEFKMPEQVKLEYLVLSRDELSKAQVVSDDEVQKYYDAHKQDLAKEERRARHILLTFPQGASAEQKATVKKQAEAVLAEVQQNAARFAEIAKQKSQDPGSAANGGDLGWFGRGMMVKPFEDAVFALEKGKTSTLVESEFGFHIIKLDDVRNKALADAKSEILETLKQQKAQNAFQVQMEKFNEIVYQQADSLQPAANELKLQIHKSDWIGKQGAQNGDLASPKLMEAVFGDDVLKGKHNSEAIEVAPGVLVSARVIEHKPEQIPALAEVSTKISAKLREDKAVQNAMEEGAARLRRLQAGERIDLQWSQPQEVVRIGTRQIDEEQLKAIFRVPADKLPGYVGGELKGVGYLIFKVAKVSPATPLEASARRQMSDSLAQMYGQVALQSYLDGLRKQIQVEYPAAKAKAE